MCRGFIGFAQKDLLSFHGRVVSYLEYSFWNICLANLSGTQHFPSIFNQDLFENICLATFIETQDFSTIFNQGYVPIKDSFEEKNSSDFYTNSDFSTIFNQDWWLCPHKRSSDQKGLRRILPQGPKILTKEIGFTLLICKIR